MRTTTSALTPYPVWDAAVRSFHWINVLTVLALMSIGVVILNGGALGLSDAGKIALKTWHVLIGYVFLANLLWRLVWGFVGGPHARWRAMLPGGPGYRKSLGRYTASLLAGRPELYVGHNPLGRIAVCLLLLLLLVQGLSGLVLAGTDIFYPPFGYWIAHWVAAAGVNPAELIPYRPDLVDAAAYDAMRGMRAPFITIHEIGFYVIGTLVVIHIAAVVFTELRGGGTLVSGMISGRKVMAGVPEDAEEHA